MKAEKTINGSEMLVTVEGKIDTLTAPDFQNTILESIEGIAKLVIDMGAVEYISSAGLRALLFLDQTMRQKGQMVLRNIPEIVNDVFEITGFREIITIED